MWLAAIFLVVGGLDIVLTLARSMMRTGVMQSSKLQRMRSTAIGNACRTALELCLAWSAASSAVGQTNMTSGLVGWWPMDEGSGLTLNDRSGNGNTGTLHNSPVWVSGFNGSNALSFIGSNSTYVEIPDSPSLNVTNTGSLCFWVQLPPPGSDMEGIVCKGDAVVSQKLCYGFYSWGKGAYVSLLGTPNAGIQLFDGSDLIPTYNLWSFVCMTWSSLSRHFSLYINAVPLSPNILGAFAGYGPYSAGYPLRFGANGASSPGNYFNGLIQDIRIYNRELSASDVAYLYSYGGGAAWFDPGGYLASIPKPNFASGNHLSHLTRWGGVLSSNACVELAKDWNFCLPLSGYATPNVASNTAVIGTFDWGMANLARTNNNYKLSVLIDRTFTNPPTAFYCTNIYGSIATNGDGTLNYQVCPEGDTNGASSYWSNITAYWMGSLLTINSNCPIATILNGGEYGVQDVAHGQAAWLQDPRVLAQSVYTHPFLTNNASYPSSIQILDTNAISWPHYASYSKARSIGYLTSSIKQQFPNRELYIFYHEGNSQGRIWNNNQGDLTHEYELDVYGFWGWWDLYLNTSTDLPSFESYYPQDGYWTNTSGQEDLLTQYLDGIGYGFNIGYTNTYSWVCGGYSATDTNGLADIALYTGFLKCLYTTGMRGAVASYFVNPPGRQTWLLGGPGFNAPFPANSPPHWLQQMIQLSHVHAEFSQLESFMDNSDLISGPQVHVASQDQPAYEFTNTVADATARVLARKMRGANQWLITAWAAAGPDRSVTVNIPGLGAETVLARGCGSVYQATPTSLTLFDRNGMSPTVSLLGASGLRVTAAGP